MLLKRTCCFRWLWFLKSSRTSISFRLSSWTFLVERFRPICSFIREFSLNLSKVSKVSKVTLQCSNWTSTFKQIGLPTWQCQEMFSSWNFNPKNFNPKNCKDSNFAFLTHSLKVHSKQSSLTRPSFSHSGKLHYPKNVCVPLFEEELDFWGKWEGLANVLESL